MFPRAQTLYLFTNTRVPPFDDPTAWRAVNYAIDRSRIVDIFAAPEHAKLTCQILPPNIPGYRPHCPYTVRPGPTGRWTGPDMDRARSLVAQSHTARGRVTVWTTSAFQRGTWLAAGRYVVSLLDDLGYRADLKVVSDAARLFGATGDSRSRAQIGVSGWIADYPAASNFFVQLLSCRSFLPANTENANISEFCDPRIDAQIRRALDLQVTDPTAATELWAQIDHDVVDRAPWVPLVNPVGVDFVSARGRQLPAQPAVGDPPRPALGEVSRPLRCCQRPGSLCALPASGLASQHG